MQNGKRGKGYRSKHAQKATKQAWTHMQKGSGEAEKNTSKTAHTEEGIRTTYDFSRTSDLSCLREASCGGTRRRAWEVRRRPVRRVSLSISGGSCKHLMRCSCCSCGRHMAPGHSKTIPRDIPSSRTASDDSFANVLGCTRLKLSSPSCPAERMCVCVCV